MAQLVIYLSRISTICKHSLFTRVLAEFDILHFFKHFTSIAPKSASERGKHEHFI